MCNAPWYPAPDPVPPPSLVPPPGYEIVPAGSSFIDGVERPHFACVKIPTAAPATVAPADAAPSLGAASEPEDEEAFEIFVVDVDEEDIDDFSLVAFSEGW